MNQKDSPEDFLKEELAIKVTLDCRTTVAQKFRTRS